MFPLPLGNTSGQKGQERAWRGWKEGKEKEGPLKKNPVSHSCDATAASVVSLCALDICSQAELVTLDHQHRYRETEDEILDTRPHSQS